MSVESTPTTPTCTDDPRMSDADWVDYWNERIALHEASRARLRAMRNLHRRGSDDWQALLTGEGAINLTLADMRHWREARQQAARRAEVAA